MARILIKIFRFVVFRNVFISLCAVAMVCETLWFRGLPVQFSPLLLFVFFATFFEYNLHVISGKISLFQPSASFRELISVRTSGTLKACILIGITGTMITFFMLEPVQMAGFLIAGILTLSYSIPMIRKNGGYIRVREITYLKVLAVATGWSYITVVVPLLPVIGNIPGEELILLFLRRFLFLFAITIPFEIRDVERERNFGNISLPMIYGIKRMKAAGILMLILFCILGGYGEAYFFTDSASRKNVLVPLMISAVGAAYLVLNASDKKSDWYFKFWTDGTLILQFLLLLLFNQ